MRFAVALLAVLCVAVPAIAQQPAQDQPPAAQTPAPAAAPAPMAQPGNPPAAGAKGKRMACRDEARQKGLRGASLKDAMQLCLAQARESCLKEAIANKVTGPARRDFIKTCMG